MTHSRPLFPVAARIAGLRACNTLIELILFHSGICVLFPNRSSKDPEMPRINPKPDL
jgi:hypothetical protein